MTPRAKVDRVLWCGSALRLSMKFKSLLLYCVLLCTLGLCGVLRAASILQFQSARFEASEGNGADVADNEMPVIWDRTFDPGSAQAIALQSDGKPIISR